MKIIQTHSCHKISSPFDGTVNAKPIFAFLMYFITFDRWRLKIKIQAWLSRATREISFSSGFPMNFPYEI